jgi:hypothetical protein
MCLIAIACSTFASCKDREQSGSAGVDEEATKAQPPAPVAHSTPYFLRDDKLLRIVEGTTETLLELPGASYCETDSRGQAIWLLSTAGISVYDPDSRAMDLVVAAGKEPIQAFEVRFGLDQGKVGNADPLRDDVALIVVAARRISIHSEIICEGERERLCYVETESDDPDLWELQEEAALTKSRYDELKLSKTDLLAKISTRRRMAPEEDEDDDDAASKTPLMQIEGALPCGIMKPPATATPAE